MSAEETQSIQTPDCQTGAAYVCVVELVGCGGGGGEGGGGHSISICG